MAPKVSRRTFMKIAAAGGIALSMSDKLLVSKSWAQQAESEEKEMVGYTFCDACNGCPMCGIKYYMKGDVVTRIESWPNFPTSSVCSKAYGTLQRLYHPNRLKYPMKRTSPKGSPDPGYVRISWDEAYDAIVENLNKIKTESGPECAQSLFQLHKYNRQNTFP